MLLGIESLFLQLCILFYRMAELLPTAAKSWDEQQHRGGKSGEGIMARGLCIHDDGS